MKTNQKERPVREREEGWGWIAGVQDRNISKV